jgi:hypothetical protein
MDKSKATELAIFKVTITLDIYKVLLMLDTQKTNISKLIPLVLKELSQYGYNSLDNYEWYKLHNCNSGNVYWSSVDTDYVICSEFYINEYVLELPCNACENGLDDYHNHPILIRDL